MNRYTFNVTWEHEIMVDADTEDEAWAEVYLSYPDHFGKGKGSVAVELMLDQSDEQDLWGKFDTDPEEPHIAELVLDDDNYF